jgi:hypothetical protein
MQDGHVIFLQALSVDCGEVKMGDEQRNQRNGNGNKDGKHQKSVTGIAGEETPVTLLQAEFFSLSVPDQLTTRPSASPVILRRNSPF